MDDPTFDDMMAEAFINMADRIERVSLKALREAAQLRDTGQVMDALDDLERLHDATVPAVQAILKAHADDIGEVTGEEPEEIHDRWLEKWRATDTTILDKYLNAFWLWRDRHHPGEVFPLFGAPEIHGDNTPDSALDVFHGKRPEDVAKAMTLAQTRKQAKEN